MGDGLPNNSNELPSLHKGSGQCPLLRAPREPRTSGWGPLNRVHQHNRVLCFSRPSFRARVSMSSGLRFKRLGTSLTLSPPDDLHPLSSHHTHQPSLDQSRSNHDLHGSGQGGNINGRVVLYVLPS
uniref:Uncharacterized protein n=1 Tax=Opuntia streptacantha TaxID=393608 RepID=A0A7C8ZCW3_OPUST